MPANKYALLRYRIIDRCLRDVRSPYPSRELLRDRCEEALYGTGSGRISISTIDKDLRAMREEEELGYFAPIAYHREFGGYYYSDASYSISQFSLGSEDLEALRFAATILQQFRDIPMLDHYQNAVDKIVDRLTILPEDDNEDLSQFIQFEKSTISQGNEFLGPLLQNIRYQQVCVIHYRGFLATEEKRYLIHPLLLKEYGNRWYLIAHVPDRGGRLTFGLERITALQPENDWFSRPDDFDPQRFFRYSIGITESKADPVEVILRFDRVAGMLVSTQPLHSSQQTLSNTDEGIRIRLEVIPTMELITEILSFGSQVMVESPPELAAQIAGEWKKALGRQNYIFDNHSN